MWPFKKRKTPKELTRERQADLVMSLTYYERRGLLIFTQIRVPVYVQMDLGSFIVDFVGVDRNFILELDGNVHDGREVYDDQRSNYLSKCGFDIFRLENQEVCRKNVIDIINQTEYVGVEKMRYLIDYANGVRKY